MKNIDKRHTKNPPSSTISKKNASDGSVALIHAFADPHEDEYVDYVSFRQVPITEKAVLQLCKELMTFVKTANFKDQRAFTIHQFFVDRGFGQDTIMRMKKRFPFFKQTMDDARAYLGNRREWMGLTRKWSESLVKFTMPVYDPDIRDSLEWQSTLKQITMNPDDTIKVVQIPVYIDKEEDHDDKD
jgi:hypothetical protein